jgi:hypothetical protein
MTDDDGGGLPSMRGPWRRLDSRATRDEIARLRELVARAAAVRERLVSRLADVALVSAGLGLDEVALSAMRAIHAVSGVAFPWVVSAAA